MRGSLCMQDPKMLADLDSRGTGNLDGRTVTICSGLDFVNISYNNFVAADEKTAKVRLLHISLYDTIRDARRRNYCDSICCKLP